MEFHEYANLFPMMGDKEYGDLLSDMARNGYDETAPIIFYEGKILDGRNRQKAADEIGLTPVYQEYQGDQPLEFVIRHNLHRRHLNESQRAMIAARLANMTTNEFHGNQYLVTANLQSPKVSQQAAADMLNVSARMVASAKEIERKAPELIPSIESGEKNIHQVKREIVKQERAETPELPSDKYRIIYADPPWQYGNTQPDYHVTQDDHYATMPLADICALPIASIAEDNAVLFIWCTSPTLEEVFQVIRAWGFKYKSSFVWDKVKHNMGHYNSVRHEFLLICVRGSCQPDIPKLFDSVVSEERTDHGKKPGTFRNMIDTLYPRGKRIELFARTKADGWEVFGNEPGLS